MNINLASLLKESLLLAGCQEQMVAGFDDNSTIALEFNDLSEMYLFLDKDKDRIIAWSPICDANENLLTIDLMKKLLKPAHYSDSGQNCLKDMEGKFNIYCLFNNECVKNPEAFLDAISSFFDFVQECIEVIR